MHSIQQPDPATLQLSSFCSVGRNQTISILYSCNIAYNMEWWYNLFSLFSVYQLFVYVLNINYYVLRSWFLRMYFPDNYFTYCHNQGLHHVCNAVMKCWSYFNNVEQYTNANNRLILWPFGFQVRMQTNLPAAYTQEMICVKKLNLRTVSVIFSSKTHKNAFRACIYCTVLKIIDNKTIHDPLRIMKDSSETF